MENTKLTVTLTGRAPVKIAKEDWPIIAQVRDHDNEHECQANRRWSLKVRQHADGRAIVYGVYTSQYQGERDKRGGDLLEPGANIAAAVSRVAERLEFDPALADECIADLPAETL